MIWAGRVDNSGTSKELKVARVRKAGFTYLPADGMNQEVA
jgi:hypothetical protein